MQSFGAVIVAGDQLLPSVPCATHQMSCKKIQLAQLCYEMMNYKVIPVGTESVFGDTGWYFVVLSHYKLVMLGTWSYRVSLGLLCLLCHVLKNVKIWLCVTDAGRPHRQQNIVLLSLSLIQLT